MEALRHLPITLPIFQSLLGGSAVLAKNFQFWQRRMPRVRYERWLSLDPRL
jgi:hypothetical protein